MSALELFIVFIILVTFNIFEYEWNCDMFYTTWKYKIGMTLAIIVGIALVISVLQLSYDSDLERYGKYKYEIWLQQGKYEQEYYTNHYEIEGTHIRFKHMDSSEVIGSNYRIELNDYYLELKEKEGK